MTQAPPEADEPRTDQAPSGPPPSRGSVVDAVRPADDRVVAGVCSGVARQLRMDPVILRVAVAVLTLVGLAGVILYLVAWVVLPDETTGRSVAQEHLGVGGHDSQVRSIALVGAAALAFVSLFGVLGVAPWNTPLPYAGLIALAALWWWVARPRRRVLQAEREATTDVASPLLPPSDEAEPTVVGWTAPPPPPRPPNPRHDGGRLTWATLALALVALGVLGVLDTTGTTLTWAAYPAAALGVIALGMLVGTFFGNARPLVLPALLVAGALAVTSAVPTPSAGRREYTPTTATEVRGSYELGVGDLALDLSTVTDPAALAGRTVSFENGLGQVRIALPPDLPVSVLATSRAGQVDVLGRRADGGPNRIDLAAPDATPHLRIVVSQTAGQIEVTR